MIKLKKIVISIVAILLIIGITTKVQAMTIVLDPGHGGQDPGAINGSTYEKDVNLKIARYLKEYLEPYKDVKIIMTHNGISSGELMIFERAMIARKQKADLLISLHINSSESSAPKGAEIYVSANTSLEKYNKKTTELANKILNKLSALGIANRGVITKLIPTDTSDVYSDGTRADYMGIIRYAMRGTMIDYGKVTVIQNGEKVEVPASTSAKVQNGEGIPTILVEHCFIKGDDYKYIDSDEDIKKLAKADADAIVEQYGLQLKVQENKPEPENKNIKVDEKNKKITMAPTVTINELTKDLKAASYSICNSDGETLEKKAEKLATGYQIKVANKTYTLIQMGDVTGDGKVLAVDALAVLKHSTGKKKLEGVYLEAADITKDGKILAIDALSVLKHSIGKLTIQL